MNFLAKHFFDYQSFVNLPHKAVQLHKTPPSQSGVDPSAAWGPKSLHIAGKNQPTPAARANRNNVEVKPGAHRHGRPSKLEHREWGERRGEFKPEKINPHKEIWMVQFDGVKHLHDDDDQSYSLEYFSRPPQKDELDCQILVILTFVKTGFITITLKKIKGLQPNKRKPTTSMCPKKLVNLDAKIRVQLFDSGTLLEERYSGKKSENRPATPRRTPSPVAMNHVNAVRPMPNPHPIGNHVGQHNQQAQPQNQHIDVLEEEPEPVVQVAQRAMYREVFDDETENEELLGSCTIGFVSSSRAAFHWRQMIRKHERPVCVWHRLQQPPKKP